MAYVNCTAQQNFFGNEEGKVRTGQVVALEEQYARQLEKRGLVTIAVKAMPAPSNKMMPAARNKSTA